MGGSILPYGPWLMRLRTAGAEDARLELCGVGGGTGRRCMDANSMLKCHHNTPTALCILPQYLKQLSVHGVGERSYGSNAEIYIYIIAPRYLCAMFASHQILQATLVGEQHCMWELNTQSLNGPLASEGGGDNLTHCLGVQRGVEAKIESKQFMSP